jgi:hypothetical protein
MEGKIFLRQVLKAMEKLDENGNIIPFTLECRTFNSNNKTGGRYRIYKAANLLQAEKLKQKIFNPMAHEYRQFRVRKNPNHWDNRTRNIELKNKMIRKIKILYIIKFNDLEVIY